MLDAGCTIALLLFDNLGKCLQNVTNSRAILMKLIMNMMSSRIFLLFAVAALTLTTPIPIRAWQWEDAALKRVPLPSASLAAETETSADFDSDNAPETLTLADGRVAIQTRGQTRWQSPQVWRVVQAQITDLNRDGQPEATLLVWRPFKPWPVDTWLPKGGRIRNFHNSNDESCHIILIGWKQDAFRELWAGSAMADPVNRFAATNLTGNDRQYLVTLEGRYDDPSSAPARYLKAWEWNGFGFTVVNELEGPFDLMTITQTEDGRVLILTDGMR